MIDANNAKGCKKQHFGPSEDGAFWDHFGLSGDRPRNGI